MNYTKVFLISGLHVFVTIQASADRIKLLQKQQPGGTQAHPVDGFELDIQGGDLGGKMNSTGPYALLITQKNTSSSLTGVDSRTQESQQKEAPQKTVTTVRAGDGQGDGIGSIRTGIKFLWGLLWSLED